MRSQFLSWQSYALSALCLADLSSTIWLCRVHDAAEGNPMMAFFLAQGVVAFAIAKIVMTAVPLSVLEWARRVRPRLGIMALNTALLGYLTIYGAGLAHVNNGEVAALAARVEKDNAGHLVYQETARRIAAKRALRLAESERLSDSDSAAIPQPPAIEPRVLDSSDVSDVVPFPPPG